MQTMNSIKKSGETGKGDFASREFPMTSENFDVIRMLAKQHTGIELGDHKKEMIYSRLVRRIRLLQLATFTQYCDFLQNSLDEELTPFINAITTNLTSFFREPHHFEFLTKTALPDIKKRNSAKKRLRIWSAGCSTGEEPYSIAITLHQWLGNENWDAKLLATDLDTNVLNHGREGVYAKDRASGLSEDIIKKYFQISRGARSADDQFKVKENIRQLITFNQLNLLEEWPMKGPFDIIFCRNVVIYFNKDTQKVLFDRYASLLVPGGYLFIGHSESLHGVSRRFESIGRTIYRRIE